jgi:hypothetical protein
MDTKFIFIERIRAFLGMHGKNECNHLPAASITGAQGQNNEKDHDKPKHVGSPVGGMRLPNQMGAIFGKVQSNQFRSKNRVNGEDNAHTPSNLR